MTLTRLVPPRSQNDSSVLFLDSDHEIRTEGDLTFVEVCMPHLRRCSIAIYFRAGSRFESKDNNGISHFLEHMFFRGTKSHPSAYEVNYAIESLGATLFAATSPLSTEFELSLPSENLEQGIVLLSEIITEPLFADIDIERRVIIEEALEDYDEFGNSIDWDYLSRSRLWPEHPLGFSVTGPLKNIESFSYSDIKEYFEKYYIAKNAVICISGAFDPQKICNVTKQAFSKLPLIGEETILSSPPLGIGPNILHAKKKGSQTQIRLAFHAPGEKDKESIALSMLLAVLDDGMSTLLHRRIFDERGLAYNVSAGLDSYGDVASLDIDAGTSHDNVSEVVEQLLQLAVELKERPIKEEDLNKAKRRAIWSLEQLSDEPQAMNAWYGEQTLFHKAWSPSKRAAALLQISADDIMSIAQRVFKVHNLHLTTVGMVSKSTARQIEKSIIRFGRVNGC